jgi:hypothetical protein
VVGPLRCESCRFASGAGRIVSRLASALQGELLQAEVNRSTGDVVSNTDAEDLAMQCEASSYRLAGEAAAPRLELCERALRIDPRNVLALPGTRTRTVAQWDYVPDDNPDFARFHERFRSGLRKAGMPEQ